MEDQLRNLENYAQSARNLSQNTLQATEALTTIAQDLPNQIRAAHQGVDFNFLLTQMEQRLTQQITNINQNLNDRLDKMSEMFDLNLRQHEVRSIARTFNSQCIRREMSIILPEVNGVRVPLKVNTVHDFDALTPEQIIQLVRFYKIEPQPLDHDNRIRLASFLGISTSLLQ